MTHLLQNYFPMIRSRKAILSETNANVALRTQFRAWSSEQKEAFLDFTTGVRGIKMLYDFFFKEIMNPDTVPERLNELLSLLLKRKARIVQVLPNDNSRIADESSLLIMDIVVELDDGTIINVEIQKIGYAFPGQRCACYSADLLLRQYKRVRSLKNQKKKFTMKVIKWAYTRTSSLVLVHAHLITPKV